MWRADCRVFDDRKVGGKGKGNCSWPLDFCFNCWMVVPFVREEERNQFESEWKSGAEFWFCYNLGSLVSGCERILWAYYKCLLNLKICFSFFFKLGTGPPLDNWLSRVWMTSSVIYCPQRPLDVAVYTGVVTGAVSSWGRRAQVPERGTHGRVAPASQGARLGRRPRPSVLLRHSDNSPVS